jgi:hypothetical protein
MVEKTDAHFVERRSGKDRRTKRFGDIRWLLKTGQRRHVRRIADRRKLQMLDLYPPKMLVWLILVLFLSIADALLTLWLIENGAIELNPVLAYYLDLGPNIFMAVKYLVTVCVVLLAVLLNYVYVRLFGLQFSNLLNVFAFCFAMVVMWELFLIVRFVA